MIEDPKASILKRTVRAWGWRVLRWSNLTKVMLDNILGLRGKNESWLPRVQESLLFQDHWPLLPNKLIRCWSTLTQVLGCSKRFQLGLIATSHIFESCWGLLLIHGSLMRNKRACTCIIIWLSPYFKQSLIMRIYRKALYAIASPFTCNVNCTFSSILKLVSIMCW